VDVSEYKKGNALILALSGRLDTMTAKSLEEKILGVINAGERHLVVDCSLLDYVSSSGLRVLLMAAKRLHNANGKIVLCSLKDHVKQVFDLAGFSSIFPVHGSREEAVRSL